MGIWAHPRRYRGKPFVELISMPDTFDGTAIGPLTSGKLHGDFAAFASRARQHYSQPAIRRPAGKSAEKRPGNDNRSIKRYGLASARGLAQSLEADVCGCDEGGDFKWMWQVYRDFRKAFQLAKNGGFVSFY
jgi:hypothetical protein